MIGRSNRFHGRASIQRLYKSGKLVRSASLSLRYAPNSRRTEYRLAVVVSRKVSKSAVVRNRIRRRLYEHVRILSASIPVSHDLIITVYDENMAEMPATGLNEEVVKLFNKADLIDAGASATPSRGIVEPNK
jgi:ribonuclease P protein component